MTEDYNEQESGLRGEEAYGDDFNVIETEELEYEAESEDDGTLYDEHAAHTDIINDPVPEGPAAAVFAPMPGEPAAAEPVYDNAQAERELQELKSRQKMAPAVIGGVVVAVVCAALWAAISVATEVQYGILAIGMGFVVGYAVRLLGKAVEPKFGVIAAALALLSILLGNFLTGIGFFAKATGTSVFQVLGNVDLDSVWFVMKETFSLIDLLFYFLAVSAAYGAGFRKQGEERKK